MNGYVNYPYTGTVKGATLKKAGYYKLEVWGAQGGTPRLSGYYGGYGGYSYGISSFSSNQTIYVVVGQKGSSSSGFAGGYNGGGKGYSTSNVGSGGGGATHISTYNCGELKNCSSYKSNILIVAGGGGGALYYSSYGTTNYPGSGGGMYGSAGFAANYTSTFLGYGGTQSSGGTLSDGNCGGSTNYSARPGVFGAGGDGEDRADIPASGGGGGYYGGAGSACGMGAGGGSGYIGNSSLSNKGMFQYTGTSPGTCTSSGDTATKTTCTGNIGAHTANYANTGNGYARITYLGT